MDRGLKIACIDGRFEYNTPRFGGHSHPEFQACLTRLSFSSPYRLGQ
jgi:hypothetical protein